MKRPFLSMLLPLMLGIIFNYKIGIDFIFIILSIIIFLAIISYYALTSKGYSFLFLFLFFILGNIMTYYKVNDSFLINYENKEVKIVGTINEQISTNSYSKSYILKVSSLYTNGNKILINEKILLKIKGKNGFEIGDELFITGVMRRIEGNTNPGLFNYKSYMISMDIYTLVSVEEDDVKLISKNKLTTIERYVQWSKKYIVKLFDKNLSKENSSVMKSIILGDSSFLDEIIKGKFRDLGLAHILAVSGLHIGVISLFLFSIFRLLYLNKKFSTIITIVFLWIYGCIIGYPPSIMRALIMLTSLLISGLNFRRYDAINSLSFGGILILLINPLWLFNVGFQMSFIATLSLVLFSNRIDKIFFRNYKKLSGVISPLIAVNIGILPVTSYYFNRLYLFTIISNLLLIPLLSISVILGFAIVLVSFISVKLTLTVGIILNLLLNINNIFIELFHRIPYIVSQICSPSFMEIILYYIAVFIILGIVKLDFFDFKFVKMLYLYSAFVILFNLTLGNYSNKVEINFIDVGQGDSALIRVNNHINFLVDAGGAALGDFDVGSKIVSPYLLKNGVSKLDGVFITHFHDDHGEGIVSLMDSIHIDRIIIGYKKNR